MNLQFTQKVLNSMNDGLSVLDLEGNHLSVNKAFCEMTGYTEDELIGTGIPHSYWPKKHLDEIFNTFKKAQTENLRDLLLHFQRKNGEIFPVIVSPSIIHNESENETILIATVKDISELYEAQNQVAINKERLNIVLESSGLGIWDYDLESKKTTRTLQHDKCFGLEEYHPDWNHEAFISYVVEEDHELVNSVYSDYLDKGKAYDIDYRVKWEDGSIHWLNSSGKGIYDEKNKLIRVIGTVKEITYRKKTELALEESNREKETLLAEIHHRVKNNLAVVAGLMYLQTKDTDNPELIERLTINIDRIKSIAAIHEELYKSHDYSRISFSSNIRKVVENLNSVSFSNDEIIIELVLEEVFLEISDALPAALIVNELITNAFKHAFTGIKNPKIRIELTKKGEIVLLEITDNGVGLPEDYQPNDSLSIGLNLVNSLAKQLDATLGFQNNKGLKCSLSFKSVF